MSNQDEHVTITENIGGFPLYFQRRQPRIVTADVWAFLRNLVIERLGKRESERALAYLDQARDFYEAARNPALRSKPLLYYYSFLNLAKVAVLVKKIDLPPAPRHGITDPHENSRERIRLEGQKVRVRATTEANQLFPQFMALFGAESETTRDYRVIDILGQIPSIHRPFCRVANVSPLFVPIQSFSVHRNSTHVWSRMVLDPKDKDVSSALPRIERSHRFRREFPECEENAEALSYKSVQEPGRKNGIDRGIYRISQRIQTVGLSGILTGSGFRYYLNAHPPREILPPLAAVYAAFFYFGSISRYKPQDFDGILDGGYSWVVGELLTTQPTQFLYGLASFLAGTEVIRPFAMIG